MDNKNYLGPPPGVNKPTKLPPPPPPSKNVYGHDSLESILRDVATSLNQVVFGIEILAAKLQELTNAINGEVVNAQEETQKQPKPRPEIEPQTQATRH